MRPSTVKNIQAAAVLSVLILLLLYVSWNSAAEQIIVPTPHCTPDGDGAWCTLPDPVTATATATTTPVLTLTPFEPTGTPTTQPTPTSTRRPRPTIRLTPIRVGSNAHLPIVWK